MLRQLRMLASVGMLVGLFSATASADHGNWKSVLGNADEYEDAADDFHDRARSLRDPLLVEAAAAFEGAAENLYKSLKANRPEPEILALLNLNQNALADATAVVSYSVSMRRDQKLIQELERAAQYFSATAAQVNSMLTRVSPILGTPVVGPQVVAVPVQPTVIVTQSPSLSFNAQWGSFGAPIGTQPSCQSNGNSLQSFGPSSYPYSSNYGGFVGGNPYQAQPRVTQSYGGVSYFGGSVSQAPVHHHHVPQQSVMQFPAQQDHHAGNMNGSGAVHNHSSHGTTTHQHSHSTGLRFRLSGHP
ncbi:MAG: hypothetical protein U0892_08335 [Pirellulales bacterium]